MSSGTAIRGNTAGIFATRRRCTLNHHDVHQLAARGIGVQNIAQMLGGSMEDVRRILAPEPANDVVAVDPAPLPAAPVLSVDERLTALWGAGLPLRVIADRLGMTVPTLQNNRRRLGLPTRNHTK